MTMMSPKTSPLLLFQSTTLARLCTLYVVPVRFHVLYQISASEKYPEVVGGWD